MNLSKSTCKPCKMYYTLCIFIWEAKSALSSRGGVSRCLSTRIDCF